MKKSEISVLTIGVLIALIFLYLIYKYLPLGVALAITGACFASISVHEHSKSITYWIGSIGSWLYPIGVLYSFFSGGWIIGVACIIVGFVAYRMAKQSKGY